MKTLIRFVSTGRFPQYTMKLARIHAHHVLHIFDGGGMQLYVNNKQYILSDNLYLWYIPPGLRARYEPLPEYSYWSHRYITMNGDLSDEWHDAGLFPTEPQQLPDDADFVNRFDTVIDMINGINVWDIWRARMNMESILIDAASLRQSAPKLPTGLNIIINEIDKRMNENIDYEQLAVNNGISYRTLRRIFKKEMGISIHQYHMKQKLSVACELLKTTDLPIKAISNQLGYTDLSSFSNQFMKHLFVTPGQYRSLPIKYSEYYKE
jgi:AraC-like DNA-binding protein